MLFAADYASYAALRVFFIRLPSSASRHDAYYAAAAIIYTPTPRFFSLYFIILCHYYASGVTLMSPSFTTPLPLPALHYLHYYFSERDIVTCCYTLLMPLAVIGYAIDTSGYLRQTWLNITPDASIRCHIR